MLKTNEPAPYVPELQIYRINEKRATKSRETIPLKRSYSCQQKANDAVIHAILFAQSGQTINFYMMEPSSIGAKVPSPRQSQEL
jgi:hypothetical protein